ncbi:MAG: rhodanese-like domain-containing protein, partial [Gammaproteobacteria bacterium]|nr:rhodanese-like domain-containing protein [Gammaproteobacteria bacterium]
MSGINTISPQSMDSLLSREGPATLIDVRTPAEYRAGHAKGAISIPLDDLQPEKLSGLLGDKRLG